MPSKKSQTSNNPFFFFMQSLKPQLQRQGVVLENGNRSLAEIAGPRWAQLSDEEKQPFADLAKEQKNNKRYAPPGEDNKMDCTRQLISKRVDTVTLSEQRRRKERKQVVESWTGKDVCEESFFMVGFMSLCNMPNEKYMPCEMAITEFSLRYGMKRELHKFINPGTIPLGYRYEAMRQSEATHQIPPEGFATDTYQTIYEELLKFVNPRKQPVFPPVYCKSSETKLTEFALQWLATKAGSPNKLKKVYELEGLVCDLHAESMDAEVKMAPSNHQASELLSTTVFDYEAGARCKWHEDNEIRHCATGIVKRYCYCLSDFLCGAFGIEMTPMHLPERPDSEPCTVITPKVYNRNDRGGNRTSREKLSNKENENRGSSQSYRENSYESGMKKKQYTRRGPTYDEESLRTSSNESVTSSGANGASPPPMTGVPTMGRGRGRGRATPAQPLRRPNLPGVAASGGKVPDTTETIKHVSSINTEDADSPWLGSLGAGRGRGVRAPNTTPKVWAGGPTSPHPSVAPLPPTAWQNVPGSTVAPYPWVLQGNPNMPTWASFSSAPNNEPREKYSYPRVNDLQYHTAEGRENVVPAMQEGFKNISLFDKDSYDY